MIIASGSSCQSGKRNSPTGMEDGHKEFHMSLTKKYMTLLGIWPVNWTGTRLIFYQIYYYLIFSYFCMFVATMFVQLGVSFTTNVLAVAYVAGPTVAYFMNILKVCVYKTDKFLNIINEIQKTEKQLLSSKNQTVITIYKNNASISKKIEIYLTVMGISGFSTYLIRPALLTGATNQKEIFGGNLIIPSWYPFDTQQYHWFAYAFQILPCFYGTFYIVYTQAYYLSVLIFIRGQFKILQYTISQVFSSSDPQQSLGEWIKEHQHILRMMTELNECMNIVMFCDFMVSSLQLAMVIFQLMNVSGLEQIAVSLFCFTLNIQLYLLYWCGTEIAFESAKIASSAYQSNWYNCDLVVQKSLRIVIMRTQKPVMLRIGTIGNVQFDVLLKIYKTIYSFLCLIINNK
ncbi:odorant receptor 10-like [Rhynchophorus ferrugineus]|uniref:odorant receptor 10-like n=1 Tax=Rhynchophorus ferrugineus TaxID=354439 RepID=UPI003FCDFCBA